MNEKTAKKIRRNFNREIKEQARLMVQGYFKDKPRFYPRWLWKIGFRFYFKLPKGAA